MQIMPGTARELAKAMDMEHRDDLLSLLEAPLPLARPLAARLGRPLDRHALRRVRELAEAERATEVPPMPVGENSAEGAR